MPDQPDVIEKYLDQVCGYLQMMPEDDVAELRCELREHLHLSVEDLVANGLDPAVAPGEAVRRFGRARRVGLDIAMKSPYAWMWKRAEDDEITLSIGGSRFLGFVFSLPLLITVFFYLIEWGLHMRLGVPWWGVVLVLIAGLPQGGFNAISFTVHKASSKDFNQVSREIAIAARSFDASSLPRWKRNLNLHRVLPAMHIALPRIEDKEILRRIRSLIVISSFAVLGFNGLAYLRRVHNYDFNYVFLASALFIGMYIGEAAFLAYILYRRHRATSHEEVGHA